MQEIGRYRVLLNLLAVAEDILAINGLFFIFLRVFGLNFDNNMPYQLLLVVINSGYFLSAAFSKRIIDGSYFRIFRGTFYRVGMALFAAIACLFLAKISSLVSRAFMLFYFSSLFITIIFFRSITRWILTHCFNNAKNNISAVILGAGTMGQKLHEELTTGTYLGINVLGFFDDDPLANDGNLLGNTAQVKEYVLEQKVGRIYCALPLVARDKIKDILNFSEANVVRFFIVPPVYSYVDYPMTFSTMGKIPILSTRKIPLGYVHHAWAKRMFDIVVSGLFLITLYPIIYAILGIAIKSSSPGPVYFIQKRTGKGGENFNCLKFRSMKCNENADRIQATENDPRKTKIGNFIRKTNLDELPQFINVFKGDMSIVGPRPHMLAHTDEFSKVVENYMVRHFIKPGITGLAQVSGYRGETKTLRQLRGRVKRDIYYLENWTFQMDIKIILKTVVVAIKGDKNAY